MARTGVPKIERLTVGQASDIPGLVAYLKTSKTGKNYLGKGKTSRRLSWDIVGPFLWIWWRKQITPDIAAEVTKLTAEVENLRHSLAIIEEVFKTKAPPEGRRRADSSGPAGARR